MDQLEHIEESTLFDTYSINREDSSLYISKWSARAKLICRQWGVFLLDSLYAPREGKPILIMVIYEAVRGWWKNLELLAEVTHSDSIDQEKLEEFYSNFWFVRYGERNKNWGIHMSKDLTTLPLIAPSKLNQILNT